MNDETFEELLHLVSPYIAKQDTNMRKAISAQERLAPLSYGGVIGTCSFQRALDNNDLNFPVADDAFLVADDAFRMQKHLLKPYPGRRIVENVFGIIAKRFQVFACPSKLNAEKTTTITLACYRYDNNGVFILGTWWNDFPMTVVSGTENTSSSYISNEVKAIREELKKYFMSATGELPWQYKYI
ncbi:hypothetical protein CVS40_11891 [Lucilia cuprina]|nr:hypothetical protein CVS40_11891 [Lucilia cuprina]